MSRGIDFRKVPKQRRNAQKKKKEKKKKKRKEGEENRVQVHESHEGDDRSSDSIFSSILADFFVIPCRAIQMNSNVSSIIHQAGYQGYKSQARRPRASSLMIHASLQDILLEYCNVIQIITIIRIDFRHLLEELTIAENAIRRVLRRLKRKALRAGNETCRRWRGRKPVIAIYLPSREKHYTLSFPSYELTFLDCFEEWFPPPPFFFFLLLLPGGI